MGSRHSRARKRKLRRESSLPSFTIDDARSLVSESNDTSSDGLLELIAAANVLCSDPNSESVRIEDFMQCVRRGGVPAEMGARALNVRLGRRRDEDIRMEDIITDEPFWIDYITSLEDSTDVAADS